MSFDRDEPVSQMEPLLLAEGSRDRLELTDLALELAQKSAGLRRSLPPELAASLANLVRSMNCYYSNLIEGHATHPIDIERALIEDFSQDARRRDLQIEAKAHIEVQRWIDGGGLRGRVANVDSLREVHLRFCGALPPDLLVVEVPGSSDRLKIVPGALRTRDVIVGRHLAVSPAAVPRFMARFEVVYGGLGKTEALLACAAAHHRLLWIHPFLDGNGRVARLMSHATLLEVLDTGALWSVARGLARQVEQYKAQLAACDQHRRNDLEGRGNLSEESLVQFTRFFLTTCIDQVDFMERLMQPDLLRTRIALWLEEQIRLGRLPPQSLRVVDAVLYRGELPRGESAMIVGSGERHARRVVSALIEKGVLVSATSRAPLRLAMPATLASRWMPGLFPDLADATVRAS
jgi:Fic family protein